MCLRLLRDDNDVAISLHDMSCKLFSLKISIKSELIIISTYQRIMLSFFKPVNFDSPFDIAIIPRSPNPFFLQEENIFWFHKIFLMFTASLTAEIIVQLDVIYLHLDD